MIRLAPDLELPLDIATETVAILAKRGSGKTYTAAVITEQLVQAGVPTVVIDPVGVWWGLRSSADGNSEGLPVVIFGGDHADVPLDDRSGNVVADAIVTDRFSAILDLSHLSKSGWKRFMTDFIARIYHRNRDPLHLVIDEADSFAPQRGASGDAAPLLGAMEDLVRRGRARGIGCTLITQRPAVLHKDVLTQAEVLICLRMNGVRDVAAIDEWVRLHAEDDEAREVKTSLPSLPVGTAWVWSPGWLGVLQRVQVARRLTFDSSATPSVGEKRIVPTAMADIDLAAIGAQIAVAAEQAKADSPKELRAEVARLRRELADRPAGEVRVEHVEVPLLTHEQAKELARVSAMVGVVGAQMQEYERMLQGILDRYAKADRYAGPSTQELKRLTSRAKTAAAAAAPAQPKGSASLGRLTKAQAAIVAVLAQRGTQTQVQVAMLTGYSSRGGGFRNAIGSLRSAGLIDGGKDSLHLTDAAEEVAARVPPLPSGEALLDHWRGQFSKAERLVFDTLVDAWPDSRTQEQIAAATGYQATGGGFRNAIGRLRTLDLIAGGRDALRVVDELGEARGR